MAGTGGERGETTPAESAPKAAPELRELAKAAWTFGLLAVVLAMLTPCSSYLSTLVALPLGLIALDRSRRVLRSDAPLDEATEVYARTGQLTGLAAASFSGLLLALVATAVGLYLVMLALIFGLAAAGPGAQLP